MPGVSGVTKHLLQLLLRRAMPRSASALQERRILEREARSRITSVIVRPSWPSVRGMSTGGVKRAVAQVDGAS